jgi:hypothetical protein
MLANHRERDSPGSRGPSHRSVTQRCCCWRRSCCLLPELPAALSLLHGLLLLLLLRQCLLLLAVPALLPGAVPLLGASHRVRVRQTCGPAKERHNQQHTVSRAVCVAAVPACTVVQSTYCTHPAYRRSLVVQRFCFRRLDKHLAAILQAHPRHMIPVVCRGLNTAAACVGAAASFLLCLLLCTCCCTYC